jgi:uncharacterized protein (UPF0276 family)
MLALAWMKEPAFLRAATPILADGLVDAIEWSFDTAWREGESPVRDALLGHFASAGRLLGHGVSYSLLTAAPEDDGRKQRWLDRWKSEQTRRDYAHLSEHLSFMTAPGFRRGPDMPLPLRPETVTLGRRHLGRLVDASNCPVGLENLAFAFSRRDALDQGELLERILAPSDGFVVLDLHNLWCQAVNLDLDPIALLETYPLARVRELHVSGGSWAETTFGRVRRDTHDSVIPNEVMALLGEALRHCPAVGFVVVERLGDSFDAPEAAAELRADVEAVRSVLRAPGLPAAPKPLALPEWAPRENERPLSDAQGALYAAFEAGLSRQDAPFHCPELAPLSGLLDAAEDRMLETGSALMRRWGTRLDESR